MFLKPNNYMKQFLFILLMLFSLAYCRKIEIDISKGYTDSFVEFMDIGYTNSHGIDTIKFSNGLSLCTFYVGCCNAMFICGTSGIQFLDSTALFYRSPILNDTLWINANAAPLNTAIGFDTIGYCDSLNHYRLSRYPSYILSHVEGDEMPQISPSFKETPIYSKKILYGFSNGRCFKFQLESWIADTIHTVLNSTQIEIKKMTVRFASDSAGNGKFWAKPSAIKGIGQKKAYPHQLRNCKMLTRTGLQFKELNSIRLDLLGRRVLNPLAFPSERF
jgi:hypothetical protein